jgi:hypothetical protein
VGRILHRLGAAALITAAGGAAGPAPASARVAHTRAVLPAPWATVNVCDTVGHPDGVGVRAWMPGRRRADVLLELRIRLQFRRAGEWVAVRGADSGWILAGSGGERSAEAGQTFTVTPPRARRAYVLRGRVHFRWRATDGTVLRRAIRVTHGGHPGTMGAEPDTFSAGTCTVR